MIALSSLAAACALTGAMAGLIIFALLIVVVEYVQGGATGTWQVNGRAAYANSSAFLVVSQRVVWRVIVCGIGRCGAGV